MAQDRIIGSKLPNWANRDSAKGLRYDAATYVGIVKNNQDSTRSGRLQVWIPDFGGDEKNDINWRTVSYASPYFGATYQPESQVNNNFTGANHTYGMWMVPPDIGNQVLCTFVNGDPDRGYWFACINTTLSHYMVPGMAAGNKVDRGEKAIPEDLKVSILPETNTPPQSLPVVEFNENAPGAFSSTFYDNPKPIHTFQANILFKQGLDRDNVRGAISSSSQRETPSHVFGISTPGRAFGNDPADDPNYADKVTSGNIKDSDYAVKARKGGHQFVMDDGDVNGKDNLMRLRTAGGHQILMNDTEKVMYIANSEGSVWIELNEAGHMSIYTASGFNVRSEGDINLHSEHDVNIQADNAITMNSGASITQTSAKISISAVDSALLFGGKLSAGASGTTTIGGSTIAIGADGDVNIKGGGINLDGGGSNAVTGITATKTKFPDTNFDEATKLWNVVPDAAESIVTVMPSHEPWSRGKAISGPAPTKQVTDNVCAPKTASAGNIKGVAPKGNNNEKLVENALIQYGVKDPVQLAQIMAQCKHESGSFRYLKELGDDSYFTRPGHYEGRKDLGNTQPGDGLKFKGRGFIQITGRDIYQKAGNYLGVDLINNPGLAEQPDIAAKCVLFFFFEYKKSRTNSVNWADCTAVTKIVNGGVNGLAERVKFFEDYKAKYAGGIPAAGPVGVLTSSDGTPVTDGSGNTVKSGTQPTTDIGINNASGKSLGGASCPIEFLDKSDAYTPPGGIGTATPKLLQKQAKAMLAELAYVESAWDYTKDSGTRLGKYQVSAAYLADSTRFYIKPDALKQYGDSTLSKSQSWSGKDGMSSASAFTADKNIQDSLQFAEFNDNYSALMSNGGIKASDDICTAAGMLFVAHYFDGNAELAKTWRDRGTGKAANNSLSPEDYFNHGRYAIDVLGAGK
jgi:predicted chitinase